MASGKKAAHWLDLLPAVTRVLGLAERALRRALGEAAGEPGEDALAYRWRDGRLHPIEQVAVMPLRDLLGVEASVRRLRANTAALCAGEESLDVLLYGDRGTGKSTAVRGLLGEFGPRGLRLVELDRADLPALPDVFRALRERKGAFLVVCDDLSFDADDTAYRTLKAALDGSIEARPRNVRIAATSNRRHIVAERLAENVESGEIHPGETVEEKLSLSDRFGLALPFFSFDQDTYLRIVDQHARQLGLAARLSREELHGRALRIALERGGRTGRTARHACVRIAQDLASESEPS